MSVTTATHAATTDTTTGTTTIAKTPLVVHGLKAAAVDLRRAVDHEPENWRQQLLLARVETERGRLRAALDAYDRAQQLRPSSTFVGAGG